MTWFDALVGTVKRYWYRYAVITLLLSLVAGIWLEWRQEQDSAVTRVETNYSSVSLAQVTWLDLSSAVFSEAAVPGARYPEREELKALHGAIRSTLDEMTSFYTPTSTIAQSADNYRNALSDVAGAINQYRPNEQAMRRLLVSLTEASEVGEEFRANIDSYRTDAWRSFGSVIF